MKREDLFDAIGMVDEKRLVRCELRMDPSAVIDSEDSKMNVTGKYQKTTRFGGIRKAWLIAAVITLMLFLMGSAIAAMVVLRVDDVKVGTQSGETFEGEEVKFEAVHDTFVELGAYYPQQIPDGYAMTFVSEGSPLNNQRIDYENDSGSMISYWIFVGDPASSVEIYGIVSKTDVDISGNAGILYEQEENRRTLVWTDDGLGYGFALRTDDTAADLLAMAKSTAEGEALVPTRSDAIADALEELGDFSPGYLPEGFEEQGVLGSPLDEDGWYSYVHKTYVNKAENTNIYFAYETYVIAEENGYTDDARTICSFHIPGCNILDGVVSGEEIEINGLYGLAAENDIAWADPEKHVVYYLHSEDVGGEELLRVAQSIDENR